MALPDTPVPEFPDVPDDPGVPPVKRAGAFSSLGSINLLVADGIQVLRLFLPSEWGIVDEGGQNPFPGSNVMRVEFKQDYRISDYPVERGSFESYNKVQVPWSAKVTLATEGDVIPGVGSLGFLGSLVGMTQAGKRTAFLASVKAAAASLDLFTLLTPEASYPNGNIVHFDYDRSGAHGATLLMVDVWMEEVRETISAKYTDVKAPGAAGTVDGGQVQATPASTAVQQAAAAPSGVGQG
jgi:hypothetical protein